LNSQNFRKKIWKKVWKFKFTKKFGYKPKLYVNFKNKIKNYVKFEFLSLKTLFLGQKVWQKFSKSLERVWKSSESLETGISECSEILEIVLFRTFQKLRKNDVQLELQKREKLVSTQKPTRKFGMQGLILNPTLPSPPKCHVLFE
jgi:hypothetical protein